MDKKYCGSLYWLTGSKFKQPKEAREYLSLYLLKPILLGNTNSNLGFKKKNKDLTTSIIYMRG